MSCTTTPSSPPKKCGSSSSGLSSRSILDLVRLTRLRTLASSDVQGIHFVAMLSMAPLAAVAIVALQKIELVADTPLWLIPAILLCGQAVSTACDLWWRRAPSRVRLHVRIAAQAMVVTATIYATGWGPALAIGLVLVGQETLAVSGSSAQPAVLGWNLSFLAAGEALIALGWVPSLISVPEVHGLALLMAVGITFSYRSLHSALVEKEAAAALTESHERRFRALVQSSSDLVFVVDTAATVTYASPSCQSVLGYEPKTLMGPERGQFVHEDDLERLRQTVGLARQAPYATADFAIRVRHADTSWRWLEGIATNLLDDPAVQGLVINARDVTERVDHMRRQAAIADLGREVLRETSIEAVFAAVVEVVERMLEPCECRVVARVDGRPGDPPAGAVEPSHTEVSNMPDGVDTHLCAAVGDPARPFAQIEVTMGRRPANAERQFLESVAGVLLSAMVRTRAEDAIRHQALHDPLTGLPNRTLFNDRLEHALGRRSRVGGYVGVMVVDLDEFKNVNDSLGHLVGDALLVAVAERLVVWLRDADTIARLGGDEFAILVDDLDAPDQAGIVAQRVLDALAEPLELPDRHVAIGVSIGIALTDRAAADADLVLSHADAAMYRAKGEGKGCYRVFEAAMHAAAVERMGLDQALRSALNQGSLSVHYQPIVETGSGVAVCFEALARWTHPTRGAISPATFIPLAEESGLIIELGREVLNEACRQVSAWRTGSQHPSLRVSVNASRLQLSYPGFIDHVEAALGAADLDPSSLTLEVTESVLGTESRRVINALGELRELGVRVAIDDFGTGYSSFAALAELPIDVLKIDKRFIDNVTIGREGRGFVSAIMQIARTLRLETVAEGVERREQHGALAKFGCTYLQGFLFSPPVGPAEVATFLAKNRVDVATRAREFAALH